jgi:hypothetical protein
MGVGQDGVSVVVLKLGGPQSVRVVDEEARSDTHGHLIRGVEDQEEDQGDTADGGCSAEAA